MREVRRHAQQSEVSRKEASGSTRSVSEGVGVKREQLRIRLTDLYARLIRYAVTAETLAEYGIDEKRFEKLRRLIHEEIDPGDRAKMTVWTSLVEGYVQPLEEMVEEARRLAEQDRVPRLEQWHPLKEIAACDGEALELLPKTFSLKERIDIRAKFEALATGKEIERCYLGVAGSINTPSKRRLKAEDGRTIIAYAKERLKDAAFKMDKTVDKDGDVYWHISQQVYNPTTNAFDWQVFNPRDIDDDPDYEKKVREQCRQLTSEGFGVAVRARIAQELGITLEEVPYDNEVMNAKGGVLPGEMTIREWANSRIDLLLGLCTFPLTVARPEPSGHDIASVQEEVQTADPEVKARQLTIKEAAELFETSPEKWGTLFPDVYSSVKREEGSGEPEKSITRAGIMAYLMGDLDGIEQNCMFDPVSKKMSRIDGGLSLGVLTGKTVKFEIAANLWTTKTIEESRDEQMRSVPLELVMHHGLKLDKEAHAYLRHLFPLLKKEGSKERTHLQTVFDLTFRLYGKKMAEKQMEDFLNRLEDVVQNGRPTTIKKNEDYMPELEAFHLKRKAEQEAA